MLSTNLNLVSQERGWKEAAAIRILSRRLQADQLTFRKAGCSVCIHTFRVSVQQVTHRTQNIFIYTIVLRQQAMSSLAVRNLHRQPPRSSPRLEQPCRVYASLSALSRP
jgi:hypothetical protein